MISAMENSKTGRGLWHGSEWLERPMEKAFEHAFEGDEKTSHGTLCGMSLPDKEQQVQRSV